MIRHRWIGIACITLFVVSAAHVAPAAAAAPQAAAAAVKASPELVEVLSKEIGASPEQAAGAAGALFGVARSRLKPEEFSQVAAAVPGMADLLKAAPPASTGAAPIGTTGLTGITGAAGGAAGSLGAAAMAFSQLGLSPGALPKAIPVLTSFVSKSGGASVGNLLASVLK